MGTVKYTGPVASFHCPTNAEIRSLKVHFSPKQEGSGDPSPENVREIVGWEGVIVWQSGKNLFNINVPFQNPDNIKTSNTEKRIFLPNSYCVGASFSNYFNDSYIDSYGISNNVLTVNSRQGYSVGFALALTPGFSYFISATTKGSSPTIEIANYSRDGTFLQKSTTNYLNKSFIVPEDAARTVLCFRGSPAGGETIFSNIQLELGTYATLYEPYHGSTTNYEFGVLGKNKFDYSSANIIDGKRRDDSGNEVIDGTGSYTSTLIPVFPSTIYTASGFDTIRSKCIYYIDTNENFISRTDVINVNSFTFTTPSNCHYIQFQAGRVSETTWSDVQLELGDTATAYEPYNPNHTVYGGWVDLITGEVQEEYNCIDLGTLNYTLRSNIGTGLFSANVGTQTDNLPHAKDLWSGYCSAYKYLGSYNDVKSVNRGIGYIYTRHVVIKDLSVTEDDTSAIKSALDGVILAYQLATPITYSLAPTQLQTFLGQNNVWSNADYVEVEYDLHETQTLLQRKAFIMANQPHVESASGAIASFNTDLRAPLRECKVYFSPVQEGTGDPSPENVRTINGWTGLTAYKTGQNIWDEQWERGSYYISTGEPKDIYDSNIRSKATSPIPIEPNTSYYVCIGVAINVRCLFYTENDEFLSAPTAVRNGIITSPSNARLMRFYVGAGYGGTYGNNIAINYPATATTYAPYSGTTIPLDWTTEAGTVYGGYVDLVSGEVWETHHKIILDGATTNCKANRDYSNSTHIVGGVVYLTPDGAADGQFSTNLLCDNMPILAPSEVSPENYPYIRTISAGAQYLRIYVGATTDHSDLDTSKKRIAFVNEYLAEHSATVVYPLATPVLVTTLTPTQLKSLRGTNNIWSSANSNIELKFYKH